MSALRGRDHRLAEVVGVQFTGGRPRGNRPSATLGLLVGVHVPPVHEVMRGNGCGLPTIPLLRASPNKEPEPLATRSDARPTPER
jgi:hypothetical protein